MSTFQCSVVTPERSVLECDATSVVFPAHDGEIGILRGRAPLLCRLGTGRMKVRQADGSTEFLVIDGGFAQMIDNRLTILSEGAQLAPEIDRDTANEILQEAMTREARTQQELEQRSRDIERARAALRISS